MLDNDARIARAAAESLRRVEINVGFARAVVEGLVPGEIWTDDPASPGAFHARHAYGMSLLWGDALDGALEPAVRHLLAADRHGDEWLQIDPRWNAIEWDRLLGAVPHDDARASAAAPRVTRYSRVNFRFDRRRFASTRRADAMPNGWTARRAVEADFRMDGSVVPKHFWRTARQFLDAGGGWCLERAGQVGAIAFTSFRFDDESEIGIETMPAFRRQGLAQAAATVMIDDLIAQGSTPIWSCRLENVASYELALALGFEVTYVGPYYRIA